MADSEHSTGKQPWKIVERRLVLDRSPYMRVYDEDVQLPTGECITNWSLVELVPFVIIFAMLEDGRVPLVQQFRKAVNVYTLELPAGGISGGMDTDMSKREDYLPAAKRELREEAGVESDDWQFLGRYIMDANRECGWCHVYLAKQARQVMAPESGDLGEWDVHFLALNEVRQRWANGEFVSGPTALAVGLALNALMGLA